MKPEGSIPYSQEPSNGPYPEQYQSNPLHPILSKIHFDIVYPYLRGLPSGCLIVFPFLLQYLTYAKYLISSWSVTHTDDPQ
jgi:hypothetical protein